jgi:hypothetical protein
VEGGQYITQAVKYWVGQKFKYWVGHTPLSYPHVLLATGSQHGLTFRFVLWDSQELVNRETNFWGQQVAVKIMRTKMNVLIVLEYFRLGKAFRSTLALIRLRVLTVSFFLFEYELKGWGSRMNLPPGRRWRYTFLKNLLIPVSPQLRWIHLVRLRANITSNSGV